MNLEKSRDVFQPNKYQDKINIIGCGSVGSTLAENLARLGLTNFVLWDFDDVEAKNIANQMFFDKHIGMKKLDAVAEMMKEINPELENTISLKYEGWKGELLEGYVFLAVDNIETRKEIVKVNKYNPHVKAMFDIRTGLYDAQHYAARWNNYEEKEDFLKSMNFSHEEAMEETPMSACHTVLSVCPTIRTICAYAVANFMNLWNKGELKRIILANAFAFVTDPY